MNQQDELAHSSGELDPDPNEFEQALLEAYEAGKAARRVPVSTGDGETENGAVAAEQRESDPNLPKEAA